MPQDLFVIDVDRCTGCSACVVACANENPIAHGLSWREVHTYNKQRLPSVPVIHYSMACNHCLDPACMAGCPANAYDKDPSTGAVLIDPGRCIGCRFCSWVCPYDAPQYGVEMGIMEKCTFCNHRLHDGLAPACVVACPTDALAFESGAEAASIDRPGFPDTGLRPAVRVIGNRREKPPSTSLDPIESRRLPPAKSFDWRGLRSEWSLWLFSTAAALLVAWFVASASGHTTIALPVFATVGILSMATSILHLGRIARFWRAASNFRSSWVSREVVLYSTFFAGACIAGLKTSEPTFVWGVAGVGLAALFAMDMVYRVPGQTVQTVPHSAMATLTVAFYIGILISSPVLAFPAAATKLILFLARGRHPQPGQVLLMPVRIGIGLVVPCAIMAASNGNPGIAVTAAVLGELIDRAEFYATLQFLTPALQIDRDLTIRA